jgi:hypothetical protein
VRKDGEAFGPRRVAKAGVEGDEGAPEGAAVGPRQCGAELECIRGAQGMESHQPDGFLANLRAGCDLRPTAGELMEHVASSLQLWDLEISLAAESRERRRAFHHSPPPNRNRFVLLGQRNNPGG